MHVLLQPFRLLLQPQGHLAVPVYAEAALLFFRGVQHSLALQGLQILFQSTDLLLQRHLS